MVSQTSNTTWLVPKFPNVPNIETLNAAIISRVSIAERVAALRD